MSHWAFAVLTVVNCSRLDVYPPSSSAKERCASIFFCISFSLTTQFSKVYETFPPLEQLILRKWINKNMILCLRSLDHLPCSFLSHDEKRQFSSLSSCVSKSPLKSVIHSTTLNLRAKHWKNYSCLVSTIFSKMQIHLLKKKGGGWVGRGVGGKEKDRFLALFLKVQNHKFSMISFGLSSSSSTPWMQLTFLFLYLLVSSFPILIHTHIWTNSTEKCEFYH